MTGQRFADGLPSEARAIIKAYYPLMGATALTRAADNSQQASQNNLDVVGERVAAGVAPNLDLDRAVANFDGANQDVADAQLSVVLAARARETLARVTPHPATDFPPDELQTQTRLDAARLSYLSSPSAQAQERLTNATGFIGKPSIYTLTATLAFRFDLATIAQKDAADAAADAPRAHAEGTRRSAEDAMVEAWSRVRANIAKARAARARLDAACPAALIAVDRYGSGLPTQFDVTHAQRDEFRTDVARIQADLDLAQSRAILRLAVGIAPLDRSPSTPNSAERIHP